MMTSYASVRSAVESMKFGAAEYISKPFDHNELLSTIARVLREISTSTQNAAMRRDLDRLYPDAEMATSNKAMQESISGIRNLSANSQFVYLQGERGTSKELLARICHANSDRSNGPLVFADLPSYNPAEIEQRLFGSSTEQDRHTSGLLQVANGGTLVVSGINKLSLGTQARLTTLLLDARNKQRAPHLRLIVLATDSPLKAVKDNLLHPLLASQFGDSVFLSLPLRSRREDIGRLSAQYLQSFAKRYRKRQIVLSDEAIYALQAYNWPGNINELKSVIERAVLMAESGEIKPAHLGFNITPGDSANSGIGLSLDAYFRYFVLNFERHLTETELASKLGISRKALWERRQKMDLLRRA